MFSPNFSFHGISLLSVFETKLLLFSTTGVLSPVLFLLFTTQTLFSQEAWLVPALWIQLIDLHQPDCHWQRNPAHSLSLCFNFCFILIQFVPFAAYWALITSATTSPYSITTFILLTWRLCPHQISPLWLCPLFLYKVSTLHGDLSSSHLSFYLIFLTTPMQEGHACFVFPCLHLSQLFWGGTGWCKGLIDAMRPLPEHRWTSGMQWLQPACLGPVCGNVVLQHHFIVRVKTTPTAITQLW